MITEVFKSNKKIQRHIITSFIIILFFVFLYFFNGIEKIELINRSGTSYEKAIYKKMDKDPNKIEKIFILKDESAKKNYFSVMEDMPSEYMDVTNMIIKHSANELKCKLNDNIFISLIDHISFAIERYNKGVILQNRLLWEVKKFYPEEFKINTISIQLMNIYNG